MWINALIKKIYLIGHKFRFCLTFQNLKISGLR